MVLIAYRANNFLANLLSGSRHIRRASQRAGCENYETVSNVKVILNSPKLNLFLLRETWNLNFFFLVTSSSCCQHLEQQHVSTYILQLLELFKEFSVCRLSVFYSLQHLMNTFLLICIALNRYNRKALPNRKLIDWKGFWKTPKICLISWKLCFWKLHLKSDAKTRVVVWTRKFILFLELVKYLLPGIPYLT